MAFTAEQIKLQPVALDAPGQLNRGPGKRKLWTWVCPGSHTHPLEVSAFEDEPKHLLTEAAILADPYCHQCRSK